MKQETNTLDGILDIVLPLAPVDDGIGVYSLIAMIVLLSGIVIAIGYRWWQKPRQRCRRELGRLLHQYSDGHINSRAAVFWLAEILRKRMHCHQLSSKTGLPVHLQVYQSRWYTFIEELDAARYSGTDIEEAVLGRLTGETSFWLGRW